MLLVDDDWGLVRGVAALDVKSKANAVVHETDDTEIRTRKNVKRRRRPRRVVGVVVCGVWARLVVKRSALTEVKEKHRF